MRYAWRVDSFSGALDDMPVKDRSNGDRVLALLKQHPRFSCFDVDDKLARTLDRLHEAGRLLYDRSEGYPWTSVEVLSEPTKCEECKGSGSHHWFGRNHQVCRPCDGRGWIVASLPGEAGAICFDCGLPYGDSGFADLVVPHDAWAKISPTGDEGGLLCPTCMVRAAEKAGVEVEATFRSGPFCALRASLPGDQNDGK